MAYIYKKYKNSNGDVIENAIWKIKNNESFTCIPFDPDNTDYQEYLEWLAEGNTPEPADE